MLIPAPWLEPHDPDLQRRSPQQRLKRPLRFDYKNQCAGLGIGETADRGEYVDADSEAGETGAGVDGEDGGVLVAKGFTDCWLLG